MKKLITYIVLFFCIQTLNAQHFLFDNKCIGNVKTDSLFYSTIYLDEGEYEINNILTYDWHVYSISLYSEKGLLEMYKLHNVGDQQDIRLLNRITRYFYDANGNIQFKLTGQNQTFIGIKKIEEKYDEAYVFDLRSEITERQNSNGLVTYDYDLEERIVYVTQQNKPWMKFQFDENMNEILCESYRSGHIHHANRKKYEDGNLIEQLSINHSKNDSTYFFKTYDNMNRPKSSQTVKNDSIIKQKIYSYPYDHIKLLKTIYDGKENSTICITATEENQFLDFSFEEAVKENITSIRFNDLEGNVVKIYTFLPDRKRIQITEHHIEYY